MNDLNSQADISDQLAALQRQVFILLLALIVVSGTLTATLYHEARGMRRDLAAGKQLIITVNHDQPVIVSMINQIAVYGRTHPDIVPLLNKYGIGPNGIPTAPAPKK